MMSALATLSAVIFTSPEKSEALVAMPAPAAGAWGGGGCWVWKPAALVAGAEPAGRRTAAWPWERACSDCARSSAEAFFMYST